jgi:hypothetical protein
VVADEEFRVTFIVFIKYSILLEGKQSIRASEGLLWRKLRYVTVTVF